MNTKDRIIEQSIEAFNREGVNFRLDDIASALHISKKTIYKHFHGKEAIIRKVMDDAFDLVHTIQKSISLDESLSIQEKLQLMLNTETKYDRCLRLEFIFQIEAVYPKLFEHLMNHYRSGWDYTVELLESGIREGVFRDYNVLLVKNLLIQGLQMLHKGNFLELSGLEYRQAIVQIVNIVLRGLVI